MNEYKLMVANSVEPERIVTVLAELIANRYGLTVVRVKVEQK